MKVLIADDHPLVREGIRHVLKRIDACHDVLEAENLDEARIIIEQHGDLDLVILDLVMPNMNGAASLRELRQRFPSVPIAIVSASEDVQDIRECIDNGANGYIPKSSGNDVMRSALQVILAGGIYLPPQWKASRMQVGAGRDDEDALTRRQLQILQLLAQGKTNKEIARELAISDKTVKTHLSEIFRRLSASNRTQAVHQATTQGLLDNS